MLTNIKSQISEYKLTNGIPLLIQDSGNDVVALYWWVSVGSVCEADKESGFSHFLEHMLFKDTSAKETGRASTGKLAREIESLGGDINAYTSLEQTVYHVTCAAKHWKRVFQSFATMAQPQKFLKEDFEREREVILEELRRSNDSPDRQIFQSLLSDSYRRHPYGRPVIGTKSTLHGATVQSLHSYYRRNYVAGAMGLVVAGPFEDVDHNEVVALANKSFGKIKSGKIPNRKIATESPLRKTLSIGEVPFQVQSPSVMLGYRIPELTHADIPALDILSGILGMGEVSRLYRKLFYEKSLVTSVGAGLFVPKDPGLFYIQFETTDKGHVPDAFDILHKEIESIKQSPPDPQEYQRVIVSTESEKLYALQTADGIASRISNLRFLLGDLGHDEKYLEALHAVTPEAICEAAQKYLIPERLSITVLRPKEIEKFDLSQIQKTFSASRISRPKTKPSKKRLANIPSEIKGKSGIRYVIQERPRSKSFSAILASIGGQRLEPLPGVAQLLAQTWNKGTTRKDSKQIAGIIEGLAASLDGYSGKSSSGLQLVGLARDAGQLLPLFNEILLDAQFLEDELEHTRRVMLDGLKSVEDHSSQLCSKLFAESLFGNHPYARHSYGDVETLKKLSRERVLEFHRTLLHPARMVVSIAGGVNSSQIHAWIEDLESKIRTDNKTGVAQVVPQADTPRAPRWIERRLEREQVHIMKGTLGMTVDSPDRYIWQILQAILGGQSGRLFIELREKRSFAYSVSPYSFEGIDPGSIGTYIGCSPSKVDDAERELARVYEDIANSSVTATELNRAIEYLLGRHSIDSQADSSVATANAISKLYGLEFETLEVLEKCLREVTREQIREFVERFFVKSMQVTCRVG